MRRKIHALWGVIGCLLLLMNPNEVAQSAREAMAVWSHAYAPSMFAYFVLMDAICSREAMALYERLLHRVTMRWFGCPGRVSGAMMISWMAGSPAGAIAMKKSADGLTKAQYARAAIVCSGVSPAFLLGVVGVGMLNSGEMGRILVCAQGLATVMTGLIFRRAWKMDTEMICREVQAETAAANPMREAAIQMLTVCGWMIVFSVLSGVVVRIVPIAGGWLLPFLEITGGCLAIAGMPMPEVLRMTSIAFVCGLSGAAIFLQNHIHLHDVSWRRLLLGKFVTAVLMALFSYLQLRIFAFPFWGMDMWRFTAFETSVFLGGALTIAVWGMVALGSRAKRIG